MFAKIKRFIKLDLDFRPQARNTQVPPRDYALPAPLVSDLLHSFAHDAIESGVFDVAVESYAQARREGDEIPEAIRFARREWDF
jgi:hypothetical protein